jgi:hypothetical protein
MDLQKERLPNEIFFTRPMVQHQACTLDLRTSIKYFLAGQLLIHVLTKHFFMLLTRMYLL